MGVPLIWRIGRLAIPDGHLEGGADQAPCPVVHHPLAFLDRQRVVEQLAHADEVAAGERTVPRPSSTGPTMALGGSLRSVV